MCTHIIPSRANMMNKKQNILIYHTNFSSFCLRYLSHHPLPSFSSCSFSLSILFLLLSSSDTKKNESALQQTLINICEKVVISYFYIQSLVVWQLRKLLLKSQLKVQLSPIEQKWADGKEPARHNSFLKNIVRPILKDFRTCSVISIQKSQQQQFLVTSTETPKC